MSAPAHAPASHPHPGPAALAARPPATAPASPRSSATGSRRPGVLTAVRIETSKMRRLRTLSVTAALVATTVAMSSMNLFSDSAREGFQDPGALPWASLLLSTAMTNAMVGPVLVAVLASRQTDIEHSGAGWNLAATSGITPGALCRAKVAALALIIVPAMIVQSAALALLGRAAGITVALDAGPWTAYTLMLIALNIAMCAFHVWLAAVVDNQLVGVGLGLLGGFLAVFMLLAPRWLAGLVPWGYYAMITNASITNSAEGFTIRYVDPPLAWIGGFLALAALAFTLATRRLDRIER